MRNLLCLLAITGVSLASTDIFSAIRDNDLAAVKKLVSTSVNIRGDRNVTPLMYAAAFGSAESVRLLLDAGANVNDVNAFGATALLWGINDPHKVKMLLDKGANPNAATKAGKTPLLVAAHQDGSLQVVKMLLAKGAKIDVRDNVLGLTPLHAATFAGDTAVIRLLVQRGHDVNARDNARFTPLMHAAGGGNLAAVRLLLAKGADVNAVSGRDFERTVNGPLALGDFTPLLVAATYGPPQLVRALIDAGADVNARDVRGMTPLMLGVASQHANPEIIRMLRKAGANLEVQSQLKESASDWARKFNIPGVLKALDLEAAQVPGPAVVQRISSTQDGIREIIQRAIPSMQKSDSAFFTKGGGCVACHHQSTTSMVVGLARSRGIAVDTRAADEHIKTVRGQWRTMREGLLQRLDPPGGEDHINYPLWGLAELGYRPDSITDAMVFDIAGMQKHDGSWRVREFARSPSSDSSIPKTVMSIRSLKTFGPPGRRAEFEQRIARAGRWLAAAAPVYNEEFAMLLLGLKWTGAPQAKLSQVADALIAQQHANGGWSQNTYLPPDAYATGQTLYALHQSGVLAANDPVYQRGLAYLVSTQKGDGTWHVSSRAAKFQPYFQSGFPHDHDQWISCMGTAWATTAMLLSIDVEPAKHVAATGQPLR